MPDYEKEQNVSLEVILRKGDADTWSPRPMPSAIWSAWLLQFIGRTLTRRWKNFGLSSRPANSSPASRVCSHDIDAQMSVAPSTKIRWKVSPWHPRAHNPKYRIDESSIAICYPPPASFSSGQVRRELLPNFIWNIMPSVCWSCHSSPLLRQYDIKLNSRKSRDYTL